MAHCTTLLLALLALRPTQPAAIAAQPALNTAEIAKRAIPAVVLIKGTDADGREISGSGFIVDPSGVLITNLHVVVQLRRATVRLSTGDVYDRFSVRSFDERRDLAVLKVAAFGLPYLACGNSDSVHVGDPVALVGNPLQLEGSITSGVISGVRSLEQEGYRIIQTDAAANPGNSGGPLIDAKGCAIGVLTFKLRDAENLNFVVPINYARGMLADSAAFSLDELRSKLRGIEPLKQSSLLPTRWKSLTSGLVFRVRQDGKYIYVEVDLPDELKKAGAFDTAELVKDSTKFVGKTRFRYPCAKKDWVTGQVVDYSWYTDELAIEITLLSPTRIEGTVDGYPKGDTVNCTTFVHSKQQTKLNFVWIPE